MSKIIIDIKEFNKLIKIVNQNTFKSIINNDAKELRIKLYRETMLGGKLKCFIGETSIIKHKCGVILGNEKITLIKVEENE